MAKLHDRRNCGRFSPATTPVDPQIWRKAHEAHVSEEKSIYTRLVKREIDRDEAKRQLSEVREKVKVTYFALIKAEHNE